MESHRLTANNFQAHIIALGPSLPLSLQALSSDRAPGDEVFGERLVKRSIDP